MKWLRKMKSSRLWKSRGGAVILGGGYLVITGALHLFGTDFNTMNAALGYILVPGSLLVQGLGTGLIGASWTAIIISTLMYAGVGYLVDYYYKPKR